MIMLREASVLACVFIAACVTESDNSSSPPTDAGTQHDAVTGDAAPPRTSMDAEVSRDAGADAMTADAAPAAVCQPLDPQPLLVFETGGPEPSALFGQSATSQTEQWQLAGMVVSHGTGFPRADAPQDFYAPSGSDHWSYLRIRGSDRSWTIAGAAPAAASFGVRDGAEVSASVRYAWGGFSPVLETLSLSVDDDTAFHASIAGGVGELGLPTGWQVEQTDSSCEDHGTCGAWANYGLSVTAPSKKHVSLAAGNTQHVDGFSVSGGSSQQLPGQQGGCSDWYVSASQLVLVRDEPLGPAAFSCKPVLHSSLPGVSVQFPDDAKCQFTLDGSEIHIPYQLVVSNDVPGVRSKAPDIGGCKLPAAGELGFMEEVSGSGQYYGVLDIGGCGGFREGPAGTLPRGTTNHEFVWDGSDWSGPSDTSEPKRGNFPPGVYTFSVRASGHLVTGDEADAPDDAGVGTAFEVTGSVDILLVRP